MRVLIVKTSSLGDVIHALPAVTDACAALPQLRFDWLVEKAFSEIPAWHAGVERVIVCNVRDWRKRPLATLRSGDWHAFRGALRETSYDLVLDAQGLLKSALLATQARGLCVGPDKASAREPLAALFYRRGIPVPRQADAHAVERMRLLFSRALGYPAPTHAPDFGLRADQFVRGDLPSRYVVLLHATTWPTKQWPEASWQELGGWLASLGITAVLPWGNEREQAAAQRIAAPFAGVVLPKMRLTGIAGVLAHAAAIVGVDTGLSHLAAALGTPAVTLYGPTLPALTGTVGERQLHLRSGAEAVVDRARPTTVPVVSVQEALKSWLTGPAAPAAPTQTTAARGPAAVPVRPPRGRPTLH
jgi:heptosyltransferase I